MNTNENALQKQLGEIADLQRCSGISQPTALTMMNASCEVYGNLIQVTCRRRWTSQVNDFGMQRADKQWHWQPASKSAFWFLSNWKLHCRLT